MSTQASVPTALSGWLADAALKAHVDWGVELRRMRDLLPLPFPALRPPPFEAHPPGWEPIWWPINSAQQEAINCRAELLLFGGQSGGGKTSLLAADAMQEYRNPYLKSLVLRTTRTEMGELSDQMQKMYEPLGAKWKRPNKFEDYAWFFSNGGAITPGYIRNEKDLNRYQGNPKSHIALDESGQHPEKLVRRLLGWLAAPRHSGLFVRARFGSNPGGPGHGWQSAVFLRGRCPVHYPADYADLDPRETSVVSGRVYKGARWPSDGASVYKTTSFIPARLIDNPLYDRVKLESLLTQTADIREQLLYGCWCNAEGLYFPFLRPEYQVPFQTIKREWWWGHFISIDYGYGNSAAAAGLYAIAPSGVVYKVGERVEKKMNSKEFARRICTEGFKETQSPRQGPMEAWTKKLRPRDPEGPRILWAMFDPANDQHTGTGQSNYEQMGEVFRGAGIPTMLGAHDPMGNAQNLYNGLVNRELVITTACPYTYNTLISRVVDDRKAVKKEKGNPQDDNYDECVAEGTRIETPDGTKPVERMRTGDLVLTRSGARRVLWAGMTDGDAELFTVSLSNGVDLKGTANHPVFVLGRGFIRLSELNYGDKIWACPEPRKSSIVTASGDAVPVHVQSVSTGGRGRVFNLTVEGAEEFFANGILVHNCSYAWNTWKEESVKPERVSLEQELDQMRKDGVDETSIARYSWKRQQEIRQAEEKAERGVALTGRRIGRRITRR